MTSISHSSCRHPWRQLFFCRLVAVANLLTNGRQPLQLSRPNHFGLAGSPTLRAASDSTGVLAPASHPCGESSAWRRTVGAGPVSRIDPSLASGVSCGKRTSQHAVLYLKRASPDAGVHHRRTTARRSRRYPISGLITRAGSTPVSRWSSPWNRYVKRSWSIPKQCSMVAFRSRMCTGCCATL